MNDYGRPLESFGIDDVDIVGGKNASLGEMFGAVKSKGVRVPDESAVTDAGYREFITHNDLDDLIAATVDGLDVNDDRELARFLRSSWFAKASTRSPSTQTHSSTPVGSSPPSRPRLRSPYEHL